MLDARRTRGIIFNRNEDKLSTGERKISYSADTPDDALFMKHALVKFFSYSTVNQTARALSDRYISAVIISVNTKEESVMIMDYFYMCWNQTRKRADKTRARIENVTRRGLTLNAGNERRFTHVGKL